MPIARFILRECERDGCICFFSYAHADDDNTGGRIAEMATCLRGEYQVLSGERLHLFVDKDSEQDGLKWGDEWRRVIDSRLEETAFFIAVLSPSYLASEECRREFLGFRGVAASTGETRLILPILFADIRRLNDTTELVEIAKDLHWEDWTQTRLTDRDSLDFRKSINRMANRLLKVQESIDVESEKEPTSQDHVPVVTAATELSVQDENDEVPGTIDQIAATEEGLSEYGQQLQLLNQHITRISDTFSEASPQLKKAKSFAQSLRVYKTLASDVSADVGQFDTISLRLSELVTHMDPGLRSLLALNEVALQSDASDDEEARKQIREFLDTIVTTSEQLLGMIESAEASMSPVQALESHSRQLRPQLRRLGNAVSRIADSKAVFADWRNIAKKLLVSPDDGSPGTKAAAPELPTAP